MQRHTPWTSQISVALAALVLCAFATGSRTNPTDNPIDENDSAPTDSYNITNFKCPEDCHCVLAHNTHKPFLHAKCSSLNGLKSEAPLQATLPIHSIDLSYLNLPRLSHSLEKLRDLTSIDLSHNELHEIGHLGRRIKKLNLKHNRITSNKLSKLPQHVQVLNLQHNDITYLPLDFTGLMQLKTLELSHNQINCSCDTLSVRNWLQERHVFMEHPVKCTYPAEVYGKPWLQVKQSDICDKEKSDWNVNENENELMMGDQPIEGSGDNDEEEELGMAFMPIEKSGSSKSSEVQLDDVEGSGDLSEMSLPLGMSSTTQGPEAILARSHEENSTELAAEDDSDDDGSGSGAGILIIPHIARGPLVTDDFEAPDSTEAEDDLDNKPVEQPAPETTPSPDMFGNGMGIFDGTNDSVKTDKPVDEELIVPVVHHNVGSENVTDEDLSTEGPEDVTAGAIMHAEVGNQDDSNATYFLLGVIALIVVGLILFVAIKRCKLKHNAAHDAENPRQTELLDMDKKNPGKPKQQNGTEHAPLIGEKTKSDMAKPINGAGKKPYNTNDVKDGPAQQQPLLNGSNANGNGAAPANNAAQDEHIPKINAPLNEQAPHEYYPITPRYPTPKSPRASKYAQHPQGEQNNNNTDGAADAYHPSSPKQGRYSPVYSPETGRVKIKLTETPKPKTPMLVTRSKSNAGEIITTPVHVPAVGGANGYVVDH